MGDDGERVEVDGAFYFLCAAPSADSPLVRHHLATLPTTVPSLLEPVCELSTHLVALSQFDQLHALFSDLLSHVGDLRMQHCLDAVRDGCASVLMQQALTFQMILSSPFQNESLKHFSRMASALARLPLECVAVLQKITSSLSTLSTRLHHIQQELKTSLESDQLKLSTLRIQTVSIHQQQSQLLHQLSEYAQQYSQLQASQQRMSHRKSLCNILSFVPSVDQSLRTSYNLHLFQPLSNMIQSVHHEHDQSQREKERILEVKRQQRERNKLMLNQLTTCKSDIAQVETHIRRCNELLNHASKATQAIHTVGVLALRIINAFKSILHNCHALSSPQLATLIDLTCSSTSASSSASIPTLSIDEEEQVDVLDASRSQVGETWRMKTAVQRKFVDYFALWTAMKIACEHCSTQLSNEKRMAPQISWDAFEHRGNSADRSVIQVPQDAGNIQSERQL